MAEYIERERIAMAVLGLTIVDPMVAQYADAVLLQIQQAPAADVEPVKRGEWLVLDECSNAGVYCSRCHKKVYKERYANVKEQSDYCPNCGAKNGR